MEVYSVGKSKPARLRIYCIARLGWRDVVVETDFADVPVEEFEARLAITMRVSFSDVVLPWRYMFFHPVGWYVAHFYDCFSCEFL